MAITMSALTIFLVLGASECSSEIHDVAGPAENEVRVAILPFGSLREGWEKTKGDGIPKQFWGDFLIDLRPIAVVRDRGNVAVVLAQDEMKQFGLYYNLEVSSYLPKSGNGWVFSWDECRGVLRFSADKFLGSRSDG